MYSAQYYEKLKQYKNTQIIPESSNYLSNIGTQFELLVNTNLMRLPEIVLFWGIEIILKQKIEQGLAWVMTGDFFDNVKLLNHPSQPLKQQKHYDPDHILVTPYAVFVFESKCYSHKSEYDVNAVTLCKHDGSLNDPIIKIKTYDIIMKQILAHCDVSLPVISRIVLRYEVDSFLKCNNDECQLFIMNKDIQEFVMKEQERLPRNVKDALKLLKTLHYAHCEPIGYNCEPSGWRE